jgi:hypothetical protein
LVLDSDLGLEEAQFKTMLREKWRNDKRAYRASKKAEKEQQNETSQ